MCCNSTDVLSLSTCYILLAIVLTVLFENAYSVSHCALCFYVFGVLWAVISVLWPFSPSHCATSYIFCEICDISHIILSFLTNKDKQIWLHIGLQPACQCVQVLLPLQYVRGNFVRIHSALSELLSLSERLSSEPDIDSAGIGRAGGRMDLSSVRLAVHDAFAMFQRQAQGLLQVCQ